MNKTPQQILQEAREEFEEKFIGEYDIINDGINEAYISGVADKGLYSVDGLMDTVRDWHTSTLQSFIEAEIVRLEGMKSYKHCCESGEGTECEYQKAINDQIPHLKELLETLKI